jgi:hypothetical protein
VEVDVSLPDPESMVNPCILFSFCLPVESLSPNPQIKSSATQSVLCKLNNASKMAKSTSLYFVERVNPNLNEMDG